MAEQIRTEEITTTVEYHDFYCDECECLIGTTTKDSYGGHQCLGAYELNILTPDGTFKYFNKCLCDTCKESFPARVAEALEAIGFVGADET